MSWSRMKGNRRMPTLRQGRRRRGPLLVLAALVAGAGLALAAVRAPLILDAVGELAPSMGSGETPLEFDDAFPPPPDAAPLRHPAVDLLREARVGPDGRLHATLHDGSIATLSVDLALQRRLEGLLRRYDVPWGAVVAMEPSTGRLLALAEHSKKGPLETEGLALRPIAPAASVFKVITAAALLEAGVDGAGKTCYHGGLRRIQPALLKDSPRDNRCVDLGEALGKSANVPFAKLAQRHLEPLQLRDMAERFFFDRPVRLEGVSVVPSPLAIPEDPFQFATTAAGFNQGVRLTPLHGALLTAAVANDGNLPEPRLVDAIDGVPVESGAQHHVLDPAMARELALMMEHTVTEGTARAAFRERRTGPVLPGVRIAGKTGSLFERDPFRDASWFVGFAPLDEPSIAVAAVIVNEEIWHVRAPWVAREALRMFLQEQGRR